MAGSPHIGIRPEWLDLTQEAALEPLLPIIDAHHHLWERPEGRYLFDELLADMNSGHDIRATVFVQSRSMYRPTLPPELQPVGEVEFANGVASQAACGLYGRREACAAIVGCADLTLGENVEPILDALTRAGGDRLRGIRNQTAWHADSEVVSNPVQSRPGLLTHSGFREGVRRLGGRGLSLDVWAYHTQLDDVAALADHCSETLIVLNHCGGLIGVGPYAGQREVAMTEWRSGMTALARRPNIVVKLGGLAMRVGGHAFHDMAQPPGSQVLADAWRPVVETCIALFGVGRCMFESNFPVDKGMVGYGVLWNAFKRLAAGASATEKVALFHATAARVYRLDPRIVESA